MKPISRQSVAGFTMMEMIVVVVILGILAAIAAPSWIGILNRQRLSAAQAEAVTAIREAQANAKRQKRTWEVCFQDDGTKVRWFVRPYTKDKNCSADSGPWNNMIGADANNIAIDSSSDLKDGFYTVRFQYNGWVEQLDKEDQKIVFKTRGQSGATKRCVYVATILGALRTASDKDCQ